jgi:hypothetical protein
MGFLVAAGGRLPGGIMGNRGSEAKGAGMPFIFHCPGLS